MFDAHTTQEVAGGDVYGVGVVGTGYSLIAYSA